MLKFGVISLMFTWKIRSFSLIEIITLKKNKKGNSQTLYNITLLNYYCIQNRTLSKINDITRKI